MSAVPQFKLDESPSGKSIEIGDWKITATTNPISNTAELDTLNNALGIPLPEMTFGSNTLHLLNKKYGWGYRFDTLDALKGVRNGELQEGDGGVKVGYADAWLKSRTDPNSALPMPKTVPTKPYDWTYTTTYQGHISSSDISFKPADVEDPKQNIPMAELTRQDPILFYAEVPLFEDELHDNGSSHFLVRIRVMPGCVFVLSRWTLRVDNVLFRTFDTRLYHSFASYPPSVIRESSGWEAPYEDVKKKLPNKLDLTPLTDPNFIGKTLSDFPKRLSQGRGAGTGWRGLGTKLEVAYFPQN